MGEVEVAQRDAGGRGRGDARPRRDGLREDERSDRGAQDQDPGGLRGVVGPPFEAREDVTDDGRQDARGDAGAEPSEEALRPPCFEFA